jgi:hypothetical protein
MKITPSRLFRRPFWSSLRRGVSGFATHTKLSYKRNAFMRVHHRIGIGMWYNQVLRATNSIPGKEQYRLLFTFMDYIMSVDAAIDNPDFVSRLRKKVSLGWVKRNLPNSFALAESEFLRTLSLIPQYPERESMVKFAKDTFYAF